MLDVAITGRGIVSAIGLSAKEFHRGMMNDASGIRPAPWTAQPSPRRAVECSRGG